MKKEINAFIFIVLFSAFNLFAQETQNSPVNSGIAYAYPITGITVDGDVSDWPKEIVQYPIDNIYGNKPKNKDDFDAYFQVAYNLSEQSLYIAVVVTDDSHIIDTTKNAGWDNQDTYNLYLNSKNLPSGSGVVSYQFNENWKYLGNRVDSWDPEVKKASWDNIKIASKHKGLKTIYECRIILKKQIFPGRSIGIDHIIMDKDAEDEGIGHSHATWGKYQWKDTSPGKLGFVILMKANEQLGSIHGQIKWKSYSIKGYPGTIRITSANKPALWIQTSVDSTGHYSATLPQGSYKVSLDKSFFGKGNTFYKIDKNNSSIVVRVKAKKAVNASILELSTLSVPDIIPEKGILHNFDEEKAASLDSFIKAYQDFYEIPGVSLALIKNGQVVYHKTYGVKNTYTQEPVNENTLFEAASITKVVFAFAVCRLAEKGIIDLDKPLYQYLPFEDIAHDERYKLITARYVLCHQTGFPNWRQMNQDGKLDIKFTPGTGFGYSGEGYQYLNRVVAKITNKNIVEVMNEEVINPLGLRDMYFTKYEHLDTILANGHFDNLANRTKMPNPNMAGGMKTEANAFATFVLALLNRKVLETETYNEMFKFQTVVPLNEDEKKQGLEIYYGLGICLMKTPYGLVFEHGGNNGDFKCEFKMYQDLNMGYVVFTNSNTGDRLAFDPLTEFLVTGKKKEK